MMRVIFLYFELFSAFWWRVLELCSNFLMILTFVILTHAHTHTYTHTFAVGLVTLYLGYLTEDSSLGGAISSNSVSTMSAYTGSMLRSAKAMRTPGPLHSARARRERRSRSACGASKVLVNTSSAVASSSSSNALRNSRSKMRTPMASRPKAFSADRTPRLLKKRSSSPSTPPMAFLRWPKPGEVALSKFGSPIVSQV